MRLGWESRDSSRNGHTVPGWEAGSRHLDVEVKAPGGAHHCPQPHGGRLQGEAKRALPTPVPAVSLASELRAGWLKEQEGASQGG